MSGKAIKCIGIKKSYGSGETRIDALRGINLEIDHAMLTLLVGPSGSGKSTLLSIITTILTPDEGKLFLLEQEVNQMEDGERAAFCRDNLGIVFQSLFLIPTLTVLDNVILPLMIAGAPRQMAEEKAIILLEKMNMAHRVQSSPAVLSKGQQQRAAIARAMINDAKIIVCDEPTSALDQAAGLEIMALLQALVKEAGKAVLVVTHDHRIYHFADRIVNMNDGLIIPGNEHE